jgi:hypothetical protein
VDVFTQSTRTQSGFGGTTGGFDDRFDFLLTSENMINTANLTYVEDSYQVFGNNGLSACYNSAINSSNCAISSSQFSFEIRDALHNFSDHLPVTLTLETDATLLNVNTVNLPSKFMLEHTIIKNTLTIVLDTNELYHEELIIYNSVGQRIKTLQIDTNNRQQFNVSELQNGLYYLVVPNLNPVKFIISN